MTASGPVFAGGEPIDVPEAMELLSGLERQRGLDLVNNSRDGIRVGHRVPLLRGGAST